MWCHHLRWRYTVSQIKWFLRLTLSYHIHWRKIYEETDFQIIELIIWLAVQTDSHPFENGCCIRRIIFMRRLNIKINFSLPCLNATQTFRWRKYDASRNKLRPASKLHGERIAYIWRSKYWTGQKCLSLII